MQLDVFNAEVHSVSLSTPAALTLQSEGRSEGYYPAGKTLAYHGKVSPVVHSLPATDLFKMREAVRDKELKQKKLDALIIDYERMQNYSKTVTEVLRTLWRIARDPEERDAARARALVVGPDALAAHDDWTAKFMEHAAPTTLLSGILEVEAERAVAGHNKTRLPEVVKQSCLLLFTSAPASYNLARALLGGGMPHPNTLIHEQTRLGSQISGCCDKALLRAGAALDSLGVERHSIWASSHTQTDAMKIEQVRIILIVVDT